MSGPGRDKNVWGYSSNGQDADEFNAAEADKGFGPPSAQELASKAPGAGRAQADMAGYAQQRWTPMNGVPVPAVPPGLDSHMAPAAYGGMKQSSAQSAAAALQMFEAKGVTVPSRVQAEEAAMATRNRLLTQEYAAQKALQPHRQKAEESAKQTASRLQKDQVVQHQLEKMKAHEGGLTERYQGVLKGFWPQQGYGFIACNAIKQSYGCDVFFNQHIEGGINIGSSVSFILELNKQGKPQARDARVEATRDDKVEKEKESGPLISDLVGKVFKGRVKSFSAARGYGFLTCPELRNTFPRDIYVSQAQAGEQPLVGGNEIQFRLALSPEGHPQAQTLSVTKPPDAAPVAGPDLGELPTAESVGEKLLARLST